jgi:hypothetical protein
MHPWPLGYYPDCDHFALHIFEGDKGVDGENLVPAAALEKVFQCIFTLAVAAPGNAGSMRGRDCEMKVSEWGKQWDVAAPCDAVNCREKGQRSKE